ncbi:hypothetical protein COCNU_09G000220 [Cocos nucifera]|uniref:Uncharacterized protein n=1 Tax=Cocos nucifera TaxID=13894 RepID=A0A8K0N6V9_COCNU|nr:hypothetical protein COCNU_09G000220 [Cocos nucifera]
MRRFFSRDLKLKGTKERSQEPPNIEAAPELTRVTPPPSISRFGALSSVDANADAEDDLIIIVATPIGAALPAYTSPASSMLDPSRALVSSLQHSSMLESSILLLIHHQDQFKERHPILLQPINHPPPNSSEEALEEKWVTVEEATEATKEKAATMRLLPKMLPLKQSLTSRTLKTLLKRCPINYDQFKASIKEKVQKADAQMRATKE